MKQIDYFANSGYEKLFDYLKDALEEITVYKRFNKQHWKIIKTTNKFKTIK